MSHDNLFCLICNNDNLSSKDITNMICTIIDTYNQLEFNIDLFAPTSNSSRTVDCILIKSKISHQDRMIIFDKFIEQINILSHDNSAKIASLICSSYPILIGYTSICKLVENKINLATIDVNTGMCLIHYICSKNFNRLNSEDQLNAIKLLLKHKVNLEIPDSENWYPIHYICSGSNNLNSNDQMTAIQLLIEHGVNLNVANKNNWYPIHFVCSESNNLGTSVVNVIRVIEMMIDHGVDLNVCNRHNRYPIELVCKVFITHKDLFGIIEMMIPLLKIDNLYQRLVFTMIFDSHELERIKSLCKKYEKIDLFIYDYSVFG